MPDYREALKRGQQRAEARPRKPSDVWVERELAHCAADCAYFIDTYCQIYDNATHAWIEFRLWEGQRRALAEVIANKYTIVLKARQEGLSWLLGDAFPLWQCLFHPIAEVLLFSQRDDEATSLLKRMYGTYERLPDWMKPRLAVNSAHELRFDNGSGVQALPATTGGRSNAATYVFIDEADFIEHPDTLVNFVRPTIDVGANKMVINSTVNKETPGSYFQRLYQSVRDSSIGGWGRIFLGWFEHPGRSREWYDEECHRAMRLYGTLDSVYEQYPETDAQALQGRTMDRRFPPQWIAAVYEERLQLDMRFDDTAPTFAGLKIFLFPEPGRNYAIGADPAEGNVRSDDSVICVVEAGTKEQVAVYGGKCEPATLADYACQLSVYYNGAPILPERNNHGHLMINALMAKGVSIRQGEDGKPGWLNLKRRVANGSGSGDKISVGSKVHLYDTVFKVLQELITNAEDAGEKPYPIIFSYETSTQLSSLGATSLSAPEGQHDDYAVGWALAQMCAYRGVASMEVVRHNLWAGGEKPQHSAQKPTFGSKEDMEVMLKLRARGIKTRW